MVKLSRDDMVGLAVAVGAPMVAGQLVALPCVKDVKGWYTRVKKPKWTPPNWVFGAVWPILYLGQGVSSWLVYRTKGAKLGWPLGLYGAQLALNLLWQPLMFKLHRPTLAAVDSGLMMGVATAATAVMAKTVATGKERAFVLASMGTYVGWLAFATTLSSVIAHRNPNAQNIDTSPENAPGLVPPKGPMNYKGAALDNKDL